MEDTSDRIKFSCLQNVEPGEVKLIAPQEKVDSPKEEPIPASVFKSIEAEEFYEGVGELSLWLVPTGYVYDNETQQWVQDIGDY